MKGKENLNKILQALLNKSKDSGWIYPSLTNFNVYTAVGSTINYAPQYKRVNSQIQIAGTVSPKTASIIANGAEADLFNIPYGYRPATEIIAVMQGSVRSVFLLRVTPSGVVKIGRYRTADSYPATVATTTWLPFSVTYFTDDKCPRAAL